MDTLLKEEELIQAIVEAVAERCRCGISMDHFAGGAFRCFQESSSRAVVYRTKLLLTLPNVTEYIPLWASTGPLVSISAVLLQVDGTCPFHVDSFNDPECGEMTERMTTDSSNLTTNVGMQLNELTISIVLAVGFVAMVVVLFGCVFIVVTMLFWKKFKSMKRDQYT